MWDKILTHLIEHAAVETVKHFCDHAAKKEQRKNYLSENGLVEIAINGNIYETSKNKGEKILRILSYETESRVVEVSVDGKRYWTSKSKAKNILKIL